MEQTEARKINLKTGVLFDLKHMRKTDYEKALKLSQKKEEVLIHALQDKDLNRYLTHFCKRYYDQLISMLEVGQPMIHLLDEKDKLFFEVLSTHFGLEKIITLALILVKQKEVMYDEYCECVGDKCETWQDVVQKSLVYDVRRHMYGKKQNKLEPHVPYMLRKIKEDNIKFQYTDKAGIKKITNLYYKFLKQWRMAIYDKLILEDKFISDIDKAIDEELVAEVFKDKYLLSLKRDDYVKGEKDFARENYIDIAFKERCGALLIQHFNGCAKCCTAKMGENCIEYDHFWLPKSKGGNFVMRSKEGYYINNCIPLCTSCNAAKGAKSILEAFTKEELERIIPMSQQLNGLINRQFRDFKDEDFIDRKRY